MSSSESEDDCYSNVAQKLQIMKNRYQEDKLSSTNLLNESKELDEIVKNANINNAVPDNSSVLVDNITNELTESVIDLSDISFENSLNRQRVTRSSTKRNKSDLMDVESCIMIDPINDPPSSVSRGKGRNIWQRGRSTRGRKNSPQINTSSIEAQGLRGNRGRSNRRNRGTPRNVGRGRSRRGIYSNISVFSIGNTHEYPDQSDNQTLFSTKQNSDEDIQIVDTDILEENEELSVKVFWQSTEIFKFKLRKFQKLSSLYDYFSQKENVRPDKLLFTYNDTILKPDDTPDSIKYNIVKFIDGGRINQSISQLGLHNEEQIVIDGVKIKFQCQNVKKPFEVTVSLDEKLSLAMIKCSEHFELPINNLKFEFDGDSITGVKTPRELELEGGECIDVKILR